MMTTEQRQLGTSQVAVPPLGIGLASWGTKQSSYGSTAREDLRQTYRACLDAGLTFFDTAPMYGDGESERLLGEFRRRDGRPITISSKFAPPSLFTPSFTRASPRARLLKALDSSLLRLGVECIDLYQLHLPPAESLLDSYMDALAEAVKMGKVRAVGLCNFRTSLMRQAQARLASHGISLASTMVGYNVLRRYPETNGVLDACRKLQMTLIAYAPLAEGILTGKYRAGTVPIPGAYRLLFYLEQLDFLKERGESRPLLRRVFSTPLPLKQKQLEPLFVVLEEIAQFHGKIIAQVALNWLMSAETLVIPIPGAKNIRQARENAGALGWRLTDAERTCINQAEHALHD
ncbi:aldo/keto reductase [Ktedonosporobacter rubrisoli]|uniref:Aldo/keto reductase n=1 Tax=Ktedonosporobacter rubrisoli TaxID=2509675 RepID=A0A4P6JLA8_KTERU|nr:aldo/keto reductase [Ktedonosporobacter rubrisoli]QBD76017.1 aldo/keto reductase [Ktedonosporobacter rubrisoli]